MKKRAPRRGALLSASGWLRTAPHRRVRTRDVRLLLDVVQPVEVIDALRRIGDDNVHSVRRNGRLSRRSKAEHGRGQTAREECGKPELLHLVPSTFFSVGLEPCELGLRVTGFCGVLPDRYACLNGEVKGLIPLAAIGRRLAGISGSPSTNRARWISVATPMCGGSQLNSPPCR